MPLANSAQGGPFLMAGDIPNSTLDVAHHAEPLSERAAKCTNIRPGGGENADG
jgi:hypothetical protein